jgi:hypothetical protein
MAVWKYADETALRIFGLSKTQQQTLQFLRQESKTLTTLREDFHRHRLVVDIETDLREMAALGYVRKQRNQGAQPMWLITTAGMKALSEV